MEILSSSKSLRDFRISPRTLLICTLAIFIAILAAIAAKLLLLLVNLLTQLFFYGRFSLEETRPGFEVLGIAGILIPAVGAFLIGLMARFGSDKIRGHGIPEAIEAILLNQSRILPKIALLKPVSAAISIGSGGPFGTEGPIIMTGGALGSLIAQFFALTSQERKTLLVCGAAAGMTTIFGTPAAAILLAVEVLLFEWAPKSLIPVASSACCAMVFREYVGFHGQLFPYSLQGQSGHLLHWILLGLACGGLGIVLTQTIYRIEEMFEKLPIHWMWWPMIGALFVGIGGYLEPRALGVGYQNIEDVLNQSPDLKILLSIFFFKFFVWAIALGSGTSGGILAPVLIIGGSFGGILALTVLQLPIGFGAFLGMAATMGSIMRAPLTSVFFLLEVTGAFPLFLPVLVVTFSAFLLNVLVMKRSILTEKVARRGHHLVCDLQSDTFERTRIEDVMTTEVLTLPSSMTLRQTREFFAAENLLHPSFPVIDKEQKVLGIIHMKLVLQAEAKGFSPEASLKEILHSKPDPLAYPQEVLGSVLNKMLAQNLSHIAVVNPKNSVLVGYVSWKDLVTVRLNWTQEKRESFLFPRKSGLIHKPDDERS